MHVDPIVPVILGVTSLWFLALLGHYCARRLGQPGVLGELIIGLLIGGIGYWCHVPLVLILRESASVFNIINECLQGSTLAQAAHHVVSNQAIANQLIDILSLPQRAEYLQIAYAVDIFSRYGVLFLLFMAGLETSIQELSHTGKQSLTVALIGVVVPLGLGFAVAYYGIPGTSYQADLFVGATLSATSIGITARVLKEMNYLKTREARTILGAAMIDDVLGLILLSMISGMVINGAVSGVEALRIILFAAVFFMAAGFLGPLILRVLIRNFRLFQMWELKLFVGFLVVMVFSYVASLAHLGTIIGAFTAGVVLQDDYFKIPDGKPSKYPRYLKSLIAPIEFILAPLFFVLIGIEVKIESFLNLNVLYLSIGLLIAAIIGKLVSGLGAHPKDDRLLVGIGMLPRGEVGLVFASVGRTLGVISDELFSAIVFTVLATTMMTPVLLKARHAAQHKESHGA